MGKFLHLILTVLMVQIITFSIFESVRADSTNFNKESKMLLENTTVGVIGFGLKAKGQKPVIAIPGINRMEGKHWKELSKNPSVEEMVKQGKIKVIVEKSGNPQKAEESQVHPDFLDMEADEVVSIVRKCLFLPLLKDWLDHEGRPKVQRALHEQIDLAGPTAEKKTS